jgi:hypothetical protein
MVLGDLAWCLEILHGSWRSEILQGARSYCTVFGDLGFRCIPRTCLIHGARHYCLLLPSEPIFHKDDLVPSPAAANSGLQM